VIDESNAVPITNNSTSRENILIESNNQSLIVSPNPIKDKLNIEIMDENRNIADNYSISLFTLDGKKIIEKSIKSNSCILDMTNFENAIYQIILHKNNEFFGSKRVIKN
jgi:predicted P-loop ATPase/GTPase